MQIKRVTKNGALNRRKCDHCNRFLHEGQVAMVQKLNTSSLLRVDLAYHRSCIRALMDTIPDDVEATAAAEAAMAERDYFVLRDLIHTTGNPFPDMEDSHA